MTVQLPSLRTLALLLLFSLIAACKPQAACAPVAASDGEA